MKKYKSVFKEGNKNPIMVQISGRKDNKVRGTVTPEEFRNMLNVPKSSKRFLKAIVDQFNSEKGEAIAEIVLG